MHITSNRLVPSFMTNYNKKGVQTLWIMGSVRPCWLFPRCWWKTQDKHKENAFDPFSKMFKMEYISYYYFKIVMINERINKQGKKLQIILK